MTTLFKARNKYSFLHTVLLAGALIFSSDSKSNTQIKNLNYPGGITELRIPKTSSDFPIVRYGIREPALLEGDDHWRVLIGLDLETLPGEYVIYVKQAESDIPASSVKFEVVQKNYPVLGRDDLPPSILAGKFTGAVGASLIHDRFSDIDFNNTGQPTLPLSLPIQGDWNDVFGSVIADEDPSLAADPGQVSNYVYFESRQLSVVIAPQNAIVSRIVKSQQQDGLATVYLDHGRGLYSVLSGLTDLSVKRGDGIVAEAVIGKLPPIHKADQASVLIWQTLLNGVYINPLLLARAQ